MRTGKLGFRCRQHTRISRSDHPIHGLKSDVHFVDIVVYWIEVLHAT